RGRAEGDRDPGGGGEVPPAAAGGRGSSALRQLRADGDGRRLARRPAHQAPGTRPRQRGRRLARFAVRDRPGYSEAEEGRARRAGRVRPASWPRRERPGRDDEEARAGVGLTPAEAAGPSPSTPG